MNKKKKKKKKKKKARLNRQRKMKKMSGKHVPYVLPKHTGRKLKGFSNKYNYKANLHEQLWIGEKLCNVNFRASSITSCNFKNSTLEGIDFVSTNLRKTRFKNAHLKNVIFYSANLKGTDFKDAKFENVYFVTTNTEVAKNLDVASSGITVIRSLPDVQISEKLLSVLMDIEEIATLSKSRVLFVKKGKVNKYALSILLTRYSETQLIRGLQALQRRKDKRGFFTLYSYMKFLDSYLKI